MLTSSTGFRFLDKQNETQDSPPLNCRIKNTLTLNHWWWQVAWSLFYFHLGEPRGFRRVQPCFWANSTLTSVHFFFYLQLSGLNALYRHLLARALLLPHNVTTAQQKCLIKEDYRRIAIFSSTLNNSLYFGLIVMRPWMCLSLKEMLTFLLYGGSTHLILQYHNINYFFNNL